MLSLNKKKQMHLTNENNIDNPFSHILANIFF